jgi:lon-related putative ATP-dependent protease
MRVPAEKLRKVCDPESLRFETTESITAKDGIIGQRKAFEALRVGVGVKDKEFNIYVSGASDTGKSRLIKRFLEKIAPTAEAVLDWCYVYNFQEPDRPKAVSLPGGKAGEFKKDVSGLIAALRKNIPLFFGTAEWKQKLAEKLQSFEILKKALNLEMKDRLAEYGFKITITPAGINFVPFDPDNPGEAMPPEKYNTLTDEEKETIKEKFEAFTEEFSRLQKKLERLNVDARRAEEDLKEEEMPRFISNFTAEFREKYRQNADVLGYLDSLIEDVIKNLDRFSNGHNDGKENGMEVMGLAIPSGSGEEFFRRYGVNVLVDNSGTEKIPVVVETNPTHSNLFGSIESEMKNSVLVTSFSNIKSGALHRANGGYLIIPAYNLFKQPLFCWEAMKRTIKDQEIRIESPMSSYFGGELKSLKPQAVPFRGKIILVGDDWLYLVLYEYDDQFKNIFKIKVEMRERTERTLKMILDIVSVLAAFCAKNKLRPFDKTAAGRLIEYLSELAESQKKLSLRLGEAENVLKEADFWTREAKKSVITGREISKTLRKKTERVNLMEDNLLEYLKDEIIKIDVAGEKTCQINGLVVYKFSDQYFGLPERITAQAGIGERGVINIEEECELAGSILIKSFHIIAGYLLGRYGQKQEMSLSASVCFEQSYHGCDGDSASLAELCAVISALTGIPIKQNLAITGSMNQKGEVQAIGGVNRKIMGFFRVCRLKGRLTGDQGVIIPKDNMGELMLPREIVKAVKGGKFHIFAVSAVEEVIKYLTGRDMEEIDEKIAKRLKEFNDILEKGKKKKK